MGEALRPELRELERDEIERLWSIDRAEVIEAIYSCEKGELTLRPERHDVTGWPAGEPELYGPLLLDCVDQGGTAYGAFVGATLIGAAVLESRFIGPARDQLQLKFLHVSQRHRGAGLGVVLFDRAVARARELDAHQLYISATPSENTVGFYLRRGCRVAGSLDRALFELEPKDIHLEFDLPAPTLE